MKSEHLLDQHWVFTSDRGGEHWERLSCSRITMAEDDVESINQDQHKILDVESTNQDQHKILCTYIQI